MTAEPGERSHDSMETMGRTMSAGLESRRRAGSSFVTVPLLVLALTLLSACTTTPFTNRTQLIVVSPAQEVELGAAAFQDVVGKARVVRDPRITEPVVRVGKRIAAVSGRDDYEWEFVVIDDPRQANAFALPGGKVAVYTGLFPVASDEAGLAAVMGHEVAHAIARHGAERMTQGTLTGLALEIANAGAGSVMGGSSPQVRSAVMQALGLGAQVGVILPFGRSQESEADRIGLVLMARAGYEPEAALRLWQRMEAAADGARSPEFLSTHPGFETRQDNIRSWLEEARREYRHDPGMTIRELPKISGADSSN